MHKKVKGRSKVMKALIAIVIIVVVAVCVRFIYTSLRANHTKIDLNELSSDTATLSCAVFDGKEVWEDSTVVIKDGVITEETFLKKGEKKRAPIVKG